MSYTCRRYLFRKVLVFRCRLIRTVVNVSLIVVMMIQPSVAYFVAGGCPAQCDSGTLLCQGCGCCEVAALTEKCGCCSVPEPESRSCCTIQSESLASETGDDHPPSEAIERQAIVFGTADAAATDTPVEQAATALASTCLCGFESQPIGDSSPSRPKIERRDSVSVRFALLVTIFGDANPPSPLAHYGEGVLPLPHFSQIHLCIWRL